MSFCGKSSTLWLAAVWLGAIGPAHARDNDGAGNHPRDAAPETVADVVDFDRDVRPIFVRHCIACHGGVKQMSGLSFVYHDLLLGEGADSGLRPVVPGDPEASELFRRVSSAEAGYRMPPADEHPDGLSAGEVATLRRWIEQGAQWQEHWALVKPRRFVPPSVRDTTWPRTDIDRFVLARLQREGMAPSPATDPAIWLRRVTLDLTGLPPTLDERERFLSSLGEAGESAYEEVVDRLLASPHFGERWASVWLDVVRYADSKGLGKDEPREIWGYRDWVIHAFNQDMPYDEFTVKQIAGDLLPGHDVSDRVATAVHRLTQTNGEGGTDDEEFRVAAVLDRVNTTWQAWQGLTFGCTQCHNHPYDPLRNEDFYRFVAFFNNTADVDLDEEYPVVRAPREASYADVAARLDQEMDDVRQILFDRESSLLKNESRWQPLVDLQAASSIGASITVRRNGAHDEYVASDLFAREAQITIEAPLPQTLRQLTAIRFTALPLNLEQALRDSEWGFVVSALRAELLSPDGEAQPIPFARVLADESTPFLDPQESLNEESRDGFAAYSRIHYPRQAAVVLAAPVAVPTGSRLRVTLDFRQFILDSFLLAARRGYLDVSGDDAFSDWACSEELSVHVARLAELGRERDAISSTGVPVLRERPHSLARPTHMFTRGSFLDKGHRVSAGVPESMSPLPADHPADRLALAQWLVSPENPLTARVAVNRFWARLFGVGLVSTEEDFGSSGERPSHPELLDHLAVRFQTDFGWSVKRFLREVVLSSVYRQSASSRTGVSEMDPENVLLARGPRQRLSAEMVRDQALALAELLNRDLFGPPVRPPIPEGVWMPFEASDLWNVPQRGDASRYRRSIYTYTKRSIPYPTFAAFDAPSREFCTPRRLVSNTPIQALVTLNDEAFVECAEALAARMAAVDEDPAKQLRYGFLLATCREPRPSQLRALLDLYDRSDADTGHATRLVMAATVLLNLDEVLTR